MAVDARRRFELYAAFEPHLGETTADFLEFLRAVGEDAGWQQWNYERFRRQPAKTYGLYVALRRVAGPDAAAAVMELLDPIGWAEVWPPAEPVGSSVAATANGDDHDAR